MTVVRRLEPSDIPAVLSWDAIRDPSHLFLANLLEAALEGERPSFSRLPHRREPVSEGRFLAAYGEGGLEGLCFLGSKRLFVLGPGYPSAASAFAPEILAERESPRIGLGPPESMTILLLRLQAELPVRLLRSQPFLAVSRGDPLGETLPIRPAQPDDLAWLVEANLRLNAEDLGIDPGRVDRRGLCAQIERRMLEGRTRLAEVSGVPVAKLEIGQRGPHGALIEGVYTRPESRGRGFARRLVASAAAECLETHPRVGLHVGRDNERALRAYEAAGFREVADLRLVLFA